MLQVYKNTLYNWQTLSTESACVRPLLFTDHGNSSGWPAAQPLAELARQLGWLVLTVPRSSRDGVPILKDMYREAAEQLTDCAFYGYSNGDILYTPGLVETLLAVQKVHSSAIDSAVHADVHIINCPIAISFLIS